MPMKTSDKKTEVSGEISDKIAPAMSYEEAKALLAAAPPLESFNVPEGILEVAGEIVGSSDVVGLETGDFELLVRFLLWWQRTSAK